MQNAITNAQLRHLVDAKALRDAVIVAVPDDEHENLFEIRVSFGSAEKTLCIAGGRGVRHFKSLDAAARYVRRDLNISHPRLDVSAMRVEAAPYPWRRAERQQQGGKVPAPALG